MTAEDVNETGAVGIVAKGARARAHEIEATAETIEAGTVETEIALQGTATEGAHAHAHAHAHALGIGTAGTAGTESEGVVEADARARAPAAARGSCTTRSAAR